MLLARRTVGKKRGSANGAGLHVCPSFTTLLTKASPACIRAGLPGRGPMRLRLLDMVVKELLIYFLPSFYSALMVFLACVLTTGSFAMSFMSIAKLPVCSLVWFRRPF
jgi:hypothetical protein